MSPLRTAHAQAGRAATSRHVVDYQQIVGTQRSGPVPLSGGAPNGPIMGCLGGFVLMYATGTAAWHANGKVWNNCAVDMRQATLHVDATEYCPFGNSVAYKDIYLTPPNWPAGTVYVWGADGVAYCFLCSEGTVVEAPAYSESVTIWLTGTDIGGRNYQSSPPNPSAGPISMQNLPLGAPC